MRKAACLYMYVWHNQTSRCRNDEYSVLVQWILFDKSARQAVLWCGQDRHVGSNLVTIHHNRMLQTAEKRHNPCNSDHILGHVQFQNKSWIQNFKFSVYIHMPHLSSHNRIRNSNSFICIPRVPPSMCFWTWLFTASMCVCVCVCVCGW